MTITTIVKALTVEIQKLPETGLDDYLFAKVFALT
jgi:hypothetical protein